MTEFGHFYGGGRWRIDGWGAGPFLITIGKTTYRFEDSDRFGPHLVGKKGDLLEHDVPGERSPFWPHYNKWLEQGRKVGADGETCLYDTPRPGVYVRGIGGRKMVVQQNDADLGAGWVESE